MNDKPWYQSKEIGIALIVIIACVCRYFGIDIPLEALLGLFGVGAIIQRTRTAKK